MRCCADATTIRDKDDSWKTGLSVSAKLAATTVSCPLFQRYGYSYRARSSPVRASRRLDTAP